MPQPSRRSLETLRWLVKPFPRHLVDQVSRGRKGTSDVVPHHVVTQRLLEIVGAYEFTMVPGSMVYDDLPAIPERKKNAIPHCLTGAVYRLEFEMEPGKRFVAEEFGDCGDAYNWAHNGERGKQIASDAIKRCAMRAGVALHLWSQQHYYLHESTYLDRLLKEARLERVEAPEPVRTGDAGPTQQQEDDSPANLEETVARPRPAPTSEPEAPYGRNHAGIALAPRSPQATEIVSRFGDKAAMASGTTVQDTAGFLAEQGETEAAERLTYSEQVIRAADIRLKRFADANPELSQDEREKVREDLLNHFKDHPEEAVTMEAPDLAGVVDTLKAGGLDPKVVAVEDSEPIGDTDGQEFPPGWEPEASTQDDTPASTEVDDETGEVLPLQALADKYADGNFFHIAGALRKEHPEWAEKKIAWFNRLSAEDLALANTLVRRHWAKKQAGANA